MSSWREQYDRMRRSYDQLGEATQGTAPVDSLEAEDRLFHFFQDAYHLKDWIKNDSQVTVPRSEVEHLFDATHQDAVLALQLCADLCNGSKHFSAEGERPTRCGLLKRVRQCPSARCR